MWVEAMELTLTGIVFPGGPCRVYMSVGRDVRHVMAVFVLSCVCLCVLNGRNAHINVFAMHDGHAV